MSNRGVKYLVYYLQLFDIKEKKLGYLNELSFKQIQTLIACFFMKHLIEKTAAVRNMLLSSH